MIYKESPEVGDSHKSKGSPERGEPFDLCNLAQDNFH